MQCGAMVNPDHERNDPDRERNDDLQEQEQNETTDDDDFTPFRPWRFPRPVSTRTSATTVLDLDCERKAIDLVECPLKHKLVPRVTYDDKFNCDACQRRMA